MQCNFLPLKFVVNHVSYNLTRSRVGYIICVSYRRKNGKNVALAK
jgi:hypothetical protein